ncbi:MAG: starch-binding protein [Natronospirillum sp.]
MFLFSNTSVVKTAWPGLALCALLLLGGCNNTNDDTNGSSSSDAASSDNNQTNSGSGMQSMMGSGGGVLNTLAAVNDVLVEAPEYSVPTSELPDRVTLNEPLNIPLTGSVGGGSYRLEYAYPALESLLVAPVGMTHDGTTDRVFVTGMTGTIHVFPNRSNVQISEAAVFLDLTDAVHSDFNEQGLLGLAFDPDYANNGYFYVYYVAEGVRSQGGDWNDTVLDRFQVDPANPNRALPDSGVRLLSIPQPNRYHKGGTLAFGPDGNLYLSVGDGAWAASYVGNNRSQETFNLNGSVVRIRPLTTAAGGYSVPADNPYVNNPDVLDEIYVYGFRNPWRFDIDMRDGTLWLGDVGQQESNGEAFAFEEVNRIRPSDAGGNYGWPICEGTMNRGVAGGNNTSHLNCSSDFKAPEWAYQHNGASASIIGGVFADSPSLPSLRHHFLFGDFNRGIVQAIDEQGGDAFEVIGPGLLNHISSFGKDRQGESYVIAFNYPGSGPSGIYRIVEDDLQPVPFPQTLSATGLFSATSPLTPADGVMPYELNATMWADGAQLQHFIALPDGTVIDYDERDPWRLPVGTALVKHMVIPTDASGTLRPVNTAVLFRQTNQWTALNFHWNTEQTDATLVNTSTTQTLDTWFMGSTQPMTRNIQEASACAACHTNLNPLAMSTQQLNRTVAFDYGLINQVVEWDRLGMLSHPVSTVLPRLTNPEDTAATPSARARAYLDINCAHCHTSTSGMDLRLSTHLAQAGLLNAPTSVGSARLLPFAPADSGLFLRQTGDDGRMPVGSRYTNPLAADLFYDWIAALDAQATGIALVNTEEALAVGEQTNLHAELVYDNEFRLPVAADEASWWSDNNAVATVHSIANGSATIVGVGAGTTQVNVSVPGQTTRSAEITVTDTQCVDVEVPIEPESLRIEFANTANWNTVNLYYWNDQMVNGGAWPGAPMQGPNNDGHYFADIPFSALSNDAINVIFNNGAGTQTADLTGIDAAARYDFASGNWTALPPQTTIETQCEDVGESGDIQIRFDNPNGWAQVLIHVWDDNQHHPYGGWPGTAMTGPDADGWWTFTVAEADLLDGGINFLFHNGQGQQTGDLYADTSVSVENGELSPWTPGPQEPDDPPADPDLHIRFDNPNGWAQVMIHIWDDNQHHPYGGWPGNAMQGPDSEGWWSFTVAEADLLDGSINFLFHNGQGQQTGDLDAQQSVSYTDGELIPWDTGNNGPDTGLYRLTVLSGETVSGELNFAAGSTVAVTANPAPPEMVFDRWVGDAAAHLLGSPALSIVELVMPAQAVSLQATYRPVGEDPFVAARALYAANCASCHGADGIGGVASALNQLHTGAYTQATLAQYINDWMPSGNVGACVGTANGECAADIAAMILANGWIPESSGTASAPEERNLRLLTRQEYLNSVRDLFDIAFPDSLMGPVPADGLANNFNTASFLIVDNDRALGFELVATEVADAAIQTHGLAGLAPSCNGQLNCQVAQLGERVFRRPMSAAEVDIYADLYDADDQGRTVVQGLLSSPHFLYRSELGQPTSGSAYYQLSAHEIATLLSYTFWATTPDAELLAVANDGTLSNPSVLEAQVNRLLANPRAEAGLRRFAAGWLIQAQYGFPAINSSSLAEALNEETVRFVVRAIQNNEPYAHLLTAPYSVVNVELAEHYGMAPVYDDEWVVRSYADDRTGLLGHGSFLASRTGTLNPSPIKRGVYVREALLCQAFPTPAAADFNIDRSPEDSNRDAVSRHTSDPSCAACHQYIDGVGFGLESFGSDALFRTMEQIGTGVWVPIDSSGEINSLAATETLLEPGPGAAFHSLPQLASLLADSDLSAACYSRQFYRYALGRHELPEDEPIIRAYSADLRNGGGMRDMLVDLTLNPHFVLRR